MGRGAVAIALVLTACAGGAGRRPELLVAAAASLTEALEEIGSAYTRASGVTMSFSFGASNALARQLTAGAPADVFISADDAQMAFAARHEAVDAATIVPIVGNELAVIVASDASHVPRGAADLLSDSIRRVAMGNPSAVPAGVYGRAYFVKIGLWEQLAPKVVPTATVRAALAAVTSGAADAAVVYRTDLAETRGERLAFAISGPAAPVIVYPAAVARRSRNPAAARAFLEYLQGEDAQRTFARRGFVSHRDPRRGHTTPAQ